MIILKYLLPAKSKGCKMDMKKERYEWVLTAEKREHGIDIDRMIADNCQF